MKESVISSKAIIKDSVIVGQNVIIEDNVFIDEGVIIRDNVHIKEGTFIGARCILGEYLADFFDGYQNKYHPLIIGKNSIIRSETIIYGDTTIGDFFQTGHRVTIREKTQIGVHVRIGTLSDIQGYCEIGDYVSMHSNVHIGQASKIGNFVWIYPYVILTNDPTPPSRTLKGVVIDDFAVVATSSTILPGIHIEKDVLVGAGAVLTKDTHEGKVYVGNPAKEVCDLTQIKDKDTGVYVYPWRYTFDRGMPWAGIGYDKWKSGDIDGE